MCLKFVLFCYSRAIWSRAEARESANLGRDAAVVVVAGARAGRGRGAGRRAAAIGARRARAPRHLRVHEGPRGRHARPRSRLSHLFTTNFGEYPHIVLD